MSTDSRWSEIVAVFEAALEYSGVARDAFVNDACKDDEDLLQKVKTLIAADAKASRLFRDSENTSQADRLSLTASDVPEWIGPYRILHNIGRGGMGTVWLARRERDFTRTVAVKILDRFSPSRKDVERFRQERDILSRLEHPNIARLYDGGFDPQVGLYIAMEYVNGLPINVYCRDNDLSVKDRLELFTRVCEAVSHAHRNLVVHRDIKPSNVLVRQDGVIKLLDFGIAKWIDPNHTVSTLTSSAMTPAYASPEQILGGPVTTATDIYSMGVVLYEVITGVRPYDLRSPDVRLAEAITRSIPRNPSDALATQGHATVINPRILKGDIDRILLKALSRNPSDRYVSVDAFRQDIELYLEGRPIKGKSKRLGYVARKFVGRNRYSILVSLVVAGAMVFILGLWIDSVSRYRAQTASVHGLSTYLVDLFEIADPSQRTDTAIVASEILDLGRTQASKRLKENPKQYAAFMSLIGELYNKIGDFQAAATVHLSALSNLSEDLSVPRTDNLLGLGRAYLELGNFRNADSALHEALDSSVRLNGWGHPKVVEILSAMSELAIERDELDRVDSLVDEAMTILADVKPGANAEMAELIHRKGIVLRRRHNLEGSVSLLLQALDLYKLNGSDVLLETAGVLNSLGIAYTRMGKFELAASYFERSLEVIRNRLGESHPRLGIVLVNMSDPITQIAGPDSANTLVTKALSILTASKGRDHPDVAWALHGLGLKEMRRGDITKAESLITVATEIAVKTLPLEHQSIALLKHDLAIAQRLAGKRPAALESYRIAINYYTKLGPRQDLRRSDALNGLGKVQRDLEMIEEAIASFRECLEIRQRLLEPGHWRLGTAHSFLGEVLSIAGYYEEAGPHLKKGIEILESARGADDVKTLDARERLEEHLNRSGSNRGQSRVAVQASS